MGAAILPDLATEIIIPACAVVGIVFALVQWLLVSKVKLSHHKLDETAADYKNGFTEALIEEEEGINGESVAQKVADIQNAISEGTIEIHAFIHLRSRTRICITTCMRQ